MANKTVRLSLVSSSSLGEGIAIPRSLQERLGIPESAEITVKVGGNAATAALTFDGSGGKALVGRALAERLYLPLPRSLWVRYDSERNHLQIGPVVAVFAATRKGGHPRRRYLFGARTLDIRQLMRHGRSLGMLAYVVSPDGVDSERDALKGYLPAGRRWARVDLPLPDVVYDRIQARSWERRPSTKAAKSFLQSLEDTKYFNEGFFDKWTLHQKMAEHEVLRQYLPDTQPLTGPQSLREFLQQHPSAFLKPTEGSQGKGIVRVRRRSGRYDWRRGQQRNSSTMFDSLYQNIRRIQRQRRYIMQPDLRLATFGGAPFDVRILMQRNGYGTWMQTKIYARVAAKGRLTSNISRGGTGMGLMGVLRARFGRSRRRVRARIRRASREIVDALDEVMDGPLGEVGLDLGIDRSGRVWLIEVNAKPYRKVVDAGPKRGVRLSFRRPMAYARYLAGF